MARQVDTIREHLLRRMEDESIGCLHGRHPTGLALRVYVLSGEVLAAHADDDDQQLLRRLRATGALGPERIDALASGGASAPLADRLYAFLGEDVLAEVLFARFRENVVTFLECEEPPRFEPMDAVFVSNIQVSHDSRQLLDDASAVLERTAELSAAADRLRLHPGDTAPAIDSERALLARITAGMPLGELLVRSPFERHETLDVLADMVRAGTVTATEASSPPSAQDDGGIPGDELEAFDDHDRVRGEGRFVRTDSDLDRVDLQEVIQRRDPDAGTVLPAPPSDGRDHGAPLAHVSMAFAGPRLTTAQADGKIQVANQVLRELASTFDVQEGHGAGQARIQLLLDGTPAGLSVLFYQVEAREDGTVHPGAILHNLRRRPAAEHRRLLNRGMLDLMERALSMAAEKLPDDVLDGLLERIAGYQQRLGI